MVLGDFKKAGADFLRRARTTAAAITVSTIAACAHIPSSAPVAADQPRRPTEAEFSAALHEAADNIPIVIVDTGAILAGPVENREIMLADQVNKNGKDAGVPDNAVAAILAELQLKDAGGKSVSSMAVDAALAGNAAFALPVAIDNKPTACLVFLAGGIATQSLAVAPDSLTFVRDMEGMTERPLPSLVEDAAFVKLHEYSHCGLRKYYKSALMKLRMTENDPAQNILVSQLTQEGEAAADDRATPLHYRLFHDTEYIQDVSRRRALASLQGDAEHMMTAFIAVPRGRFRLFDSLKTQRAFSVSELDAGQKALDAYIEKHGGTGHAIMSDTGLASGLVGHGFDDETIIYPIVRRGLQNGDIMDKAERFVGEKYTGAYEYTAPLRARQLRSENPEALTP